jgi:lipopolysaccharide export system protein LptA
MRVDHDSLVWVVVLLVSSVALCRADDAKPATPPSQPGSLFQSLSLGSNKGPVHIDSDTLELDYKNSNVMYRGHVVVTQGDVTLNSDTLSISYDPQAVKQGDKPGGTQSAPAATKTATPGGDTDRIKEIIAEGNVHIKQGTKTAEGRRAVFDQAKQTFTLSDGAVLHDGPNQVVGERVIVYLKEERSVVESGSNSRVKAVLYPNKGDVETKPTPLPVQAANSSPEPTRP